MHEVKGSASFHVEFFSVPHLISSRLPHPSSEENANPPLGVEAYHDANWRERSMSTLFAGRPTGPCGPLRAEDSGGPGVLEGKSTCVHLLLLLCMDLAVRRIANTIVNLTGVFKVSGIYEVGTVSPAKYRPTDSRFQLTLDQPYCENILPFIPHFNWECSVRHFFPSRHPAYSAASVPC